MRVVVNLEDPSVRPHTTNKLPDHIIFVDVIEYRPVDISCTNFRSTVNCPLAVYGNKSAVTIGIQVSNRRYLIATITVLIGKLRKSVFLTVKNKESYGNKKSNTSDMF